MLILMFQTFFAMSNLWLEKGSLCVISHICKKKLVCDEVKRPKIEYVLHEIWMFFSQKNTFRALAVFLLRLFVRVGIDMSSAFRCSDEVRFF